MRIAIFHGYELTGSGSNEYTRYLAKSLSEAGHPVHIICREPAPELLPFVTEARSWDAGGQTSLLFSRQNSAAECVLHRIPNAEVQPVFLTDKQRSGNIKPFTALTESELREYHRLNVRVLRAILSRVQPDIVHANHLIYQPVAAAEVCSELGIPLVIYPHGSSIEYTIKKDDRYRRLAKQAILQSAGLIIGNREVRDRITGLYPDQQEVILEKTRIVGVGVDTGLFEPAGRSDRMDNIRALIAAAGGVGKNPELTLELEKRLAKLELAATCDYWDSYDHSLPDSDLNEKLRQIPWQSNILLFVGALTAGKGLQSLMVALPFILKQQPDTHLVIIGAGAYREVLEALYFALRTGNKALLTGLCGSGMDLDRNELTGPWEDVKIFLDNQENLSFLLAHAKIPENRIHFLGRLDHSRLKYIFPCVDLAVFPSVIPEAYPLVLMESLSNGVIPVVSYFSGFKDGVDELKPWLGEKFVEKMKISVDPRNRINSIISGITGLLGEPGLDEVTPKLRRIAVENYDWKIRAGQMVDAYSGFIHG